MKRVYVLFLIGLIGLFVAGCQRGERPGPAVETETETETAVGDEADETPTETVNRPAAGTTILAEGQLVAVNPVLPLGFETGGRLLTMQVEMGDVVAAGDLLATIDDQALQDNLTQALQQVAQAQNSVAAAQLALDRLLNWTPDEMAVAVAEANVAAAEANLAAAAAQDAAAGNNLTAAAIRLDQARQSLADAQEAYDTAYDPGRDWELGDPFRADFLERERDAATRNLNYAQDNVAIAQADYNLAVANNNRDNSAGAQASLLSAQQALAQAQTGPTADEIANAEIQLAGAQLSHEAAQFSLDQAEAALARAELRAPAAGLVIAVDAAPGAMVGAGTPVVTLMDTVHLQFHTSNVSERDLGQLAPGQPVNVYLKAYPETALTGTVAGIGPQAAGLVGDAAVFPVWIDLDAAGVDLRPGMTGRVEILAGS